MTDNSEDYVYSLRIRKLFFAQMLIAIIAATAISVRFSVIIGGSVLMGFVLAVLVGWNMQRGLQMAGTLNAQQGRVALLKSAVIRYVAMLLLLLLCYQLGLHLLAIAAGFFMAQCAAYVYFFRLFQKEQRESNTV